MLPLLLLVYTPKGNIAIVSEYLRQHGFLLVHPTLPSDQIRVGCGHYLNPHDITPFVVPTHFIKVPQMTYRCPVNQGDWEGARIEFHGIRLMDAINPNYTGLRGYGDHVLQYEGVGSTVSCRILNVRRVLQRIQAQHFFRSLS